MARKFQIKRGAKSTMPILAQGEFGLVIDSNAEELHIGNGSQNIQIARQDALTSHSENKDNPHAVSLTQLGVTATAEELNNVNKAISEVRESLSTSVTTLQSNIDAKANASHSHTPSEVGLSTETWKITFEDGSTVNKVVYVG